MTILGHRVGRRRAFGPTHCHPKDPSDTAPAGAETHLGTVAFPLAPLQYRSSIYTTFDDGKSLGVQNKVKWIRGAADSNLTRRASSLTQTGRPDRVRHGSLICKTRAQARNRWN
jgi:hypothetical protein